MKEKETNRLFPVFLKLEQMSVLIVGGGKVGLEKLQAILTNAPDTRITLVGARISPEIYQLATSFPKLGLAERWFEDVDLHPADIVIIAIDDSEESQRIRNVAKRHGKLVNVADKPDQCDFYLSSVVKKGNLKLAISTNGKSPTIAKRLKEILDELLPSELDEILDHMQQIRSGLKGDFADKVEKLNELTREFVLREKH